MQGLAYAQNEEDYMYIITAWPHFSILITKIKDGKAGWPSPSIIWLIPSLQTSTYQSE